MEQKNIKSLETPKKDFSTPEYKRSRKAYAAQCTFEYLVSLLVADAFLAKLLGSLGLEDSVIGIISSFISLAFMIQLLSVFLYKWKINSKKLVLIFYPISQILFLGLYMIPFLPIKSVAIKVTVMSFILIAYACQYLVYNVIFKWANSYVEAEKRASYSATKEVISLGSGIVFTAVVGFFFDKFEAAGRINDGFIMIAVLAFIISVCNIVCLCCIKKEDDRAVEQNTKSFLEILLNTLGNKNFRSVILLTIIWEMAKYFTIGFLGTYKTNDLLISVFVVQIINMLGNVMRMLVSKPFGRFSDKRSFAVGMELALVIAAIGFFVNMFTTPKTWYLIAIYTVLYAISMAGLNQNSFNITYSYVNSDYITEAMAIKNCIGGLCGFGASLLGSQILKYVQSNGNTLFGMHIYGQQLLSCISFLLTAVALLLCVFVIGKQRVMKQ
ncbi:MAG: hypothetical protein IJZ80_10800 [Clostridia bacterium]|nr:hypothetical protein [Clostridia bacterium]